MLVVVAGLVCQSWAVAKGDLSYDEARGWLAAHPSEGASVRHLRRRARRLSPGSLPAMVEVLARGSDAEVNAAFNVLYQHGARMTREGDSPQSWRYRVILPDGSVHTVRPDHLAPEDFEEQPSPPDEGPAVNTESLAKSWRSEAVLALLTAATIIGALQTKGVARLALTVLAVGTAALLAWSLIILTLMTAFIAVVPQLGRGRRRDDDDSE
ncbi:MAG: hypothetical protein QOG97_3702 [Acidimicrobiaceae bacterium]|nr:hypothetical protein [Acidimicrobiaceae bacterium]